MSNEILKSAKIEQKIFNNSSEWIKSILLWLCIIEWIIDNIKFHLFIKGCLGKKKTPIQLTVRCSQILKEVNIVNVAKHKASNKRFFKNSFTSDLC